MDYRILWQRWYLLIQSGKCEPPGGVLNPFEAKSAPPWAINEPPGGSQVRKPRGLQPSAKPKSKENRFYNEKNYQCPYKNNGDGVVPFLWLPIHRHTLFLLMIGGKHIRRDDPMLVAMPTAGGLMPGVLFSQP